jgi:chromosome segregation ATPase
LVHGGKYMTMSDTTDIEKKSLEAHVELCAERYRFLENELKSVNEKVTGLETMIQQVHAMVAKITEKRNDQLMTWGIGIMSVMVAIIAWLASKIF